MADSDDEELSELESEEEDAADTTKVAAGDQDEGEEDAEGDEDEEMMPVGPAQPGGDDLGSDDDDDDGDSRAETPDLSKMTKRQRARFEDSDGGLMKLSDGKPTRMTRRLYVTDPRSSTS
jgi:Ino eighty subunit 2